MVWDIYLSLDTGKYPFWNFYDFKQHGSVCKIYSSLCISVKDDLSLWESVSLLITEGFYSIRLLSKAQRKDVFTGLSADWEESTWTMILFSAPVFGSNFFSRNTAFLLKVLVTCFLLSHQNWPWSASLCSPALHFTFRVPGSTVHISSLLEGAYLISSFYK